MRFEPLARILSRGALTAVGDGGLCRRGEREIVRRECPGPVRVAFRRRNRRGIPRPCESDARATTTRRMRLYVD